MIRLLLFLGIIAGCQTRPTTIIETPPHASSPPPTTGGVGPEFRLEPLEMDDKTIILDARPFFQFSNGHLPHAIHVRWEDYARSIKGQKGLLDADLDSIARRLANYGITPDSNVLVVGLGKEGHGEEGRFAWMLAYLGVKKVQFAEEDFINAQRIRTPSTPVAAAVWKPILRENLMVEKLELIEALKGGKTAMGPKSEVVVLDVRSPQEYLGQSGSKILKKLPDLGAVNVEWKNFIDKNGRPRGTVISELRTLGLGKDQRIIVVSVNGVRSALVTMALQAFGYKKAGNLAGGLTQLTN